ncbi:hypothetical protein, partial [Tabrizicola flagellatus]|uniref:hypothetical protein n=1 Tax=Tabrizicola flagellatus TaxID=2593021 RepID=UPI001F37458B
LRLGRLYITARELPGGRSQYAGDEISFLTTLYYGNLERERIRAARKEQMERREWKQIDRLEALPEWLTKRSEEKDDFE